MVEYLIAILLQIHKFAAESAGKKLHRLAFGDVTHRSIAVPFFRTRCRNMQLYRRAHPCQLSPNVNPNFDLDLLTSGSMRADDMPWTIISLPTLALIA